MKTCYSCEHSYGTIVNDGSSREKSVLGCSIKDGNKPQHSLNEVIRAVRVCEKYQSENEQGD